MNDRNYPYYGTELKFLLTITAEGFSMDDDDFTVTLRNGNRSLTLTKNDCIESGGDWYIVFNSKDIGVGTISAVITAHVPDNDFPDGIRDEVYVIDRLTKILPVL